jgi:hypothetical protein
MRRLPSLGIKSQRRNSGKFNKIKAEKNEGIF